MQWLRTHTRKKKSASVTFLSIFLVNKIMMIMKIDQQIANWKLVESSWWEAKLWPLDLTRRRWKGREVEEGSEPKVHHHICKLKPLWFQENRTLCFYWGYSGGHIQLFVWLAKVHENLQDFDKDEHHQESQRRRDDQVQSNEFDWGGGEAFDGLDDLHQGVREASGGIAEEKVGGGVILKAGVAGGGR